MRIVTVHMRFDDHTFLQPVSRDEEEARKEGYKSAFQFSSFSGRSLRVEHILQKIKCDNLEDAIGSRGRCEVRVDTRRVSSIVGRDVHSQVRRSIFITNV